MQKIIYLFLLLWVTAPVSAQLARAKQDHIDLYHPDGTFNKSIFFDYYESVDQMPQYPGGEDALKTYIESQMKYPESAKSMHIQGTVLVRFIISPNGNIMNIKTLQSPPNGELLVKEAQRLVQHMPRWVPGKLGEEYVYTEMILPIVFSLK